MTALGAGVIGILFVALALSAFTAIFHIFGLLASVPCALACARIANSKRLNDRPYMIRGALYAAINFWLWFYYMKQMQDKNVSDTLLRAFYIFLFFNWLFTSVYYSFMWAIVLNGRAHDGNLIVIGVWLMSICGGISAVAWGVSLVRLRRSPYFKFYHESRFAPCADTTIRSLQSVYTMPCVLSLVFTVAPNLILWWVGGQYA